MYLRRMSLLVSIVYSAIASPSPFAESGILPLDRWTYIQVDDSRARFGDWDEPEWLRYFGLDTFDINRDGFQDIVSGRYVYRNPGADMTQAWGRIDLGFNVDGMLFTDVDGDEFADVIAEALPDVYWLEAEDLHGNAWKAMKIATLPKTGHRNGQGYLIADVIQGGKPEILLTAEDGIYCAEIPGKPFPGNWHFKRLIKSQSDEGFAAADIDGDNDLDLVCGDIPEGEKHPTALSWWENPGNRGGSWIQHRIGNTDHAIDRVKIGDLNADGKLDVVISEERSPGKEPDAKLYWFESQDNSKWKRHELIEQYSMNNLDIGDLDGDGDIDIVTNEHKGPNLLLQLFENNGKGKFQVREIDRGKECHLGTKLVDLDSDGDLDIIGHAWDNYKFLHVWRNDAVTSRFDWKHLSSASGDLEIPNKGGQQTASLIVDVDNDGDQDFVITERTKAPGVVLYRYENKTWNRYIVDSDPMRIEAGSAKHDIDGDGDLDIVFGGEGRSNEVWWWENPYPKFERDKPWTRRIIKNTGAKKHHDQLFGDFDGDGKTELVFWNQGARQLLLAEIPSNPKTAERWDYHPIYTYQSDSEMQQIGYEGYPRWKGVNEYEGLAKIDIDGDGLEDIVGGGLWFKYSKNGSFTANIIDSSYTFSRSAVGQFIEGGRPEVILVVGDGKAAMYLYEWRGKGTWFRKLLIDELDNGHTIQVLDVNHDGHLDVFSAEMRFGEGNPKSKIRIMLGDGQGNFTHHIVKEGQGVHEGKMADLDGDGDYDILAKPYSWKAPRLDIFLNVTEK